MCPKSKRSSAKPKAAAKKTLDRPFAAAVMTQARETVAKYQIIVQFEDGEWYGRGLEMPQVFGDGATPEACIKNTREALTAAVAHLVEGGQRVPVPAENGRRVSAPSPAGRGPSR